MEPVENIQDLFENWMVRTLAMLREDRDDLFKEHGLIKDEVYHNGLFDELPIELLKKICYIDAYASILKTYLNLTKTDREEMLE